MSRNRVDLKEEKRILECIYREEEETPPTERTREIFRRKAYQTKRIAADEQIRQPINRLPDGYPIPMEKRR